MWTDNEWRFLQTQRIGRLATVGPSGPQVRPVGFRLDDDAVDIGGADLSRTHDSHPAGEGDQLGSGRQLVRSDRPARGRRPKDVTGTLAGVHRDGTSDGARVNCCGT